MAKQPSSNEIIQVRPKEAFRILGISKSYGYLLLKRGILERRYIGKRRTAITMKSIKAFAEGGVEQSAPAPQPQPERPAIRRPRGSSPKPETPRPGR